MDSTDAALLARLQRDATESYASLGKAVGLSSGAAHERVRKLRERGVVRRTTIDVDPAAVGRAVLSYVLVDATAWMGGDDTKKALTDIAEVEEAHIIAGAGTLLLKVRTRSTKDLQYALRHLHGIDGVSTTRSIIVLDTIFERDIDVSATSQTASSQSASDG